MTTNPAPTADRTALREALAAWLHDDKGHRDYHDDFRGCTVCTPEADRMVDAGFGFATPTTPTADVLREWTCVCGHGEADHYSVCIHDDGGCEVTIDARLAAQPEPSAPECRHGDEPCNCGIDPEPSAPDGLDVPWPVVYALDFAIEPLPADAPMDSTAKMIRARNIAQRFLGHLRRAGFDVREATR